MIELDYRQLKGELGLDHYEGRSYLGDRRARVPDPGAAEPSASDCLPSTTNPSLHPGSSCREDHFRPPVAARRHARGDDLEVQADARSTYQSTIS